MQLKSIELFQSYPFYVMLSRDDIKWEGCRPSSARVRLVDKHKEKRIFKVNEGRKYKSQIHFEESSKRVWNSLKMSWRILAGVLTRRLEDVLKIYGSGNGTHFDEDVLNTSWNPPAKTKTEDVLKTSLP